VPVDDAPGRRERLNETRGQHQEPEPQRRASITWSALPSAGPRLARRR
jgi:hypothetical protein